MIAPAILPSRLNKSDPRDAEIARLRDRVEDLEYLLGMKDVMPDRVVGLTACECALLSLLLKRQFISHDMARIALSADAESDSYINVHISRIRTKLGPELRRCIQVVWGSGTFIAAKDKPRIRSWVAARRIDVA